MKQDVYNILAIVFISIAVLAMTFTVDLGSKKFKKQTNYRSIE